MDQLAARNKLSGSVRIRPISGFLLVAFLLAALSAYLQTSPFVRDTEIRFQTRFLLFDSFFRVPEAGTIPVVVILINDQSLPEDSPQSPIDRRWLAGLINRVSSHQPSLIGLNILLDRPLDVRGDRLLARSIAGAGNVVLRSDPLYPALPLFLKSALDYGTLRFQVDSSGAVQKVCDTALTCRSSQIFHDQLLRHYPGDHYSNTPPDSGNGWLRISFSASRSTLAGRYINTPVFRAQDLDQMPADALRDKIVLIGTGFPDLYPLYRTPLPGNEQFIQETELLAYVIETIAGHTSIVDLSPLLTGLLVFAVLSILSLFIITRGILSGVWYSMFLVPTLFIAAAIAFTRYQLAIPFVLSAVMVVLFLSGGSIQQILKERFSRLMTELQLKQAKIDFLTNELHTHHLFNELSRLNVMISRQPETARAYLVEFAELLRTSLKYGDQPRVPVSIQLEYLNTYLQQQKIVHGDRFHFSIDTNDDWQDVQSPWHVFFPLVENAVKAVEAILQKQPENPVDISITVKREKGELIFKVKNPFREEAGGPSTQKGLLNLKDRLKWSYPKGKYELTGGPQGQIWVAGLRLPLE